MSGMVQFLATDDLAVIRLVADPVNALSPTLRNDLLEAVGQFETNSALKAAIIIAAGQVFSRGLDIHEFGNPAPPSVATLCARIENCEKPMVVAVQGEALGAGGEIVLAAHYRLAAPDARIGFGEVGLGLTQSGGATQRLPRLIGAENALKMLVSGKSVDGEMGQSMGMIDVVANGDLSEAARVFAKNLIAKGQGPRPTGRLRGKLQDGQSYQQAISLVRDGLAKNPLNAQHRIVDCIEAAALLPYEAGLAFEQDAFERCLAHPQSIALRHLFMAERRIDPALIERSGAAFQTVVPMGKSTVQRLETAYVAAADFLVSQGVSKEDIDKAMIAYGFRKGPFGVSDMSVKNNAISMRLIAALVVEGAACVDQGAVQRPSDIDALAVHGMGYPRRKGGPFRAVQSIGLLALRTHMRSWAEDSDIWTVPDLLDEAIKDARGFDAPMFDATLASGSQPENA